MHQIEKILWTQNFYDELERINRVEYPDGSKNTVVYGGLKTTTVNDKNQKNISVNNLFGKKYKSIDSNNTEITHHYDSGGRLISTVLPNKNSDQNIISISYNILDQKISLTDPNKGHHQYLYNGLGKLYKHTKNENTYVELFFDKLGRTIKEIKNSPDSNSEFKWQYDSSKNGLGKLSKSIGPEFSHENKYDKHSRLINIIKSIDGEPFFKNITYDSLGRVHSVSYPENIGLDYQYAKDGTLNKILDSESKKELWVLKEISPSAKPISQKFGNGSFLYNTYDPLDDSLNNTKLISSSNKRLSDTSFEFDTLGNLTYRKDNLRNFSQNFDFDSLNRLINTSDSREKEVEVKYDLNGNILYKSDVGSYTYGQTCAKNGSKAGPNAVTSIGGGSFSKNYCYDKNGNQISETGRSIAYNYLDKPVKIENEKSYVDFLYGPTERRIVRNDLDKVTNKLRKTIYFSKEFEKIKENSSTKFKLYVSDKVIILKEKNKPKEYNYLVKDHIGSLVAIIDENQKVKSSYYYDPWGKKIVIKDNDFLWSKNLTQALENDPTTDRGFTGHEHIDSFDLVHMGGRIYDPIIGRFLSADPYIDPSRSTQSYNRYTYVENNPISHTDPSGYFLDKALKKANKWANQNKKSLVTITVAVVVHYGAAALTNGASLTVTQYYFLAATKGAIASYAGSGGNLKATAKGAIVGALLYGVGEFFSSDLAKDLGPTGYKVGKTVAHGLVGGISSVADGGKFETGFVSSAASQATGFAEPTILGDCDNAAVSTMIGATIGGATSHAMGGSFENGAITAAYGRLLNDWSHTLVDKYGSVVRYTYSGDPNSCRIGPPKLVKREILFEAGIDNDHTVEELASYAIGIGVAGRVAKIGYSAYAARGAGRVFWSGSEEAMIGAANFARANGGKTLEMTMSGRFLSKIQTKNNWEKVKPLWNIASKRFANGASNSVNVFQSSKNGVRLKSVWRRVEYPILRNKNIDIKYHITQ